MTTKKKGGLGASAWFDSAPTIEESAVETQPDNDQEAATPKTRKTFVIMPETYYLLGKMKVEAQRSGETITLGNLVDEAVRELAVKRHAQ